MSQQNGKKCDNCAGIGTIIRDEETIRCGKCNGSGTVQAMSGPIPPPDGDVGH